MHGVSKSFGATRALTAVDLAVEAGQVMALIGENGAGKSTLMKILAGALHADSGEMTIDGKAYAPRGPQAAREAGVAMIYQELNLAPDLSVEDNIMLGQERRSFGLLNRKIGRKLVCEALEQLGHPELKPETLVSQLSVGAKQLVEIARALVMKAKVIVFDEPTSSLTASDTRRLFEIIARLRDSGIGVVYISHFLEEIREVCDAFTVLRDGEVVGVGQLSETSEDEIVSLMVGRTVDELFPDIPHEIGEPLLTVTELEVPGFAANHREENQEGAATFTLHRGEILGVSGLVGAGRSELLRSLFGLQRFRSGKVRVGEKHPGSTPRSHIAAGMGFVSEDRKTEGLAQNRSLADNLTYSDLGPYQRFGWINLRKRSAAVETWLDRVHVKRRDQNQPISDLSGGNQQKVAIARVLHQEADILLLDEPTRGIDMGAKAEIYRLIGDLAQQGKAIIFVSSYLPELMAVCDTIAVMSRGKLRSIRPKAEWTEEEIIATAMQVE